jgi:radical SAM superfamily enzyme YgiQ (UPF0313 family)
VYDSYPVPSLKGIPTPRFDLLDHRNCLRWARLVDATRGCYQKCSFSSCTAYWEATYRVRPVKDVVEEIRQTTCPVIAFMDDDMSGDPTYAKELFRAMIPLGKKWVTQTRIAFLQDEEML